MAVSPGSSQSLAVVRDILKGEQQKQQRSEDRAFALLNLRVKLASDEANRLNSTLSSLNREISVLSNDFAKTTGDLKTLKKIQSDTGETKSDGIQILEDRRFSLADSIKSLRSDISVKTAQRDRLQQGLADFSRGAKTLAPQFFDSIKGDDEIVDSQELTQFLRDFREGNPNDSDAVLTGLAAGIRELEKTRFQQDVDTRNVEARERGLDISEDQVDISRRNARTAEGNLQVARDRFGLDFLKFLFETDPSRSGGSGSKAIQDARKDLINQFDQFRNSAMGLSQRLDLTGEDVPRIPKVLTSAKDVNEAFFGLADQVFRLVSVGNDFFETPGELRDAISRVKDAENSGDIKDKRVALANLVDEINKNRGNFSDILDFSIIGSDRDENNLLSELMNGLDILSEINKLNIVTNPEGIPIDSFTVPGALDTLSNPPESSVDSVSTGGLIGTFGNTLFETFKQFGETFGPAILDGGVLNKLKNEK